MSQQKEKQGTNAWQASFNKEFQDSIRLNYFGLSDITSIKHSFYLR